MKVMYASGASSKGLMNLSTNSLKSNMTFVKFCRIRNNMIDSDMCFLLMNITAAKIKKVKQQGKDQLTMIIGDESGYIHKWNLDIVEEEFRQRGF